MMRMAMTSLVLLLGACTAGNSTTGDEDIIERILDVRIDGGEPIEAELDPEDRLDSNNVKMCVTADGNVYVAWLDQRDGRSDVWFNRSFDAGTTWMEAPIRVKQGPGDASGLDMACASDRIFLVWEDNRDGETNYENIYLNYSTDGGDTWQAEDKAIDADPDGTAISLGPKIGLYQGRVHVVWFDQRNGAPDIYMSTSTNGGRGFGDPVQISGDREEGQGGRDWSGNPNMAIDKETGTIHVVWEDARNGKLDLFYAYSRNGGQGFGPQKRIDKGDEQGSGYSFTPQIAADGGRIYIVWHDDRNSAAGNRDVLFNYSADNGDTWFDAAELVESDDPGFYDSYAPDVTSSGTTAHVVWQDKRNTGFDIYYQQIASGELVTAKDGAAVVADEIRLDNGDDVGLGNSVKPVIAMEDETIVVAWEDRRADQDKGYNELYYNFFDPQSGTEESPAAWLDDDDLRLDSVIEGTSYAVEHQMDVVGGEVYSVWVDGRNGSDDVYFSRIAVGAELDFYTLEDLEGGN